MADGGYGPDFLSRSMFFREAEAGPTAQDLATMTAPFGGSVEQARALYQSPEVQARLQHFGLGGFDPNQIRQSPFFPNQFMQGHPGLGGFLNQAMAGMAATPEAPMVSGAGSGLSRFAQGAYGGPELLRQYQVRQLMAPFQAMGMQLPVMAEQRRQELLQALEQDMQRRQGMEAGQIKPTEPRINMGPYGYVSTEYQQGQPPGGPQGLDLQQTGAGHPMMPIAGPLAGQEQPMPGYGLTPEQQAGWRTQFHPYDPALIAGTAQAKETPALKKQREGRAGMDQATAAYKQALIDAGYPEADADKLSAEAERARAQADEARQNAAKGGKAAKGPAYWEKQYRDLEDKISQQIRTLESAIANPQASDEQKTLWQQQIDQLNMQREQEKAKIDAARGAPGTSVPYRPEPRYMPPGGPAKNKPTAQTGRGAQAGGVGAQQSEGTATQPSYIY